MGCCEAKAVEVKACPVNQLTIPLPTDVDCLTAYSEDKLILGGKGELQLFDIVTKSITTISKEHVGRINCVIKLSNGRVVSAGQDKTIKMWDIEKKQSTCTLKGHKSLIWCISEVQGGDKIISGSEDKSSKLWDFGRKICEGDVFKSPDSEVPAVIQLKNGKILMSSGNKLMLIDLATKKEEQSLEVKSSVWSLRELKDGTVGAGLENGGIIILEVSPELKIKTTFPKGHNKIVRSIIELSNGKIVTASDESDLIVWDPNNTESINILKEHTGIISGLAYISGNMFASVSRDNTLRIWE